MRQEEVWQGRAKNTLERPGSPHKHIRLTTHCRFLSVREAGECSVFAVPNNEGTLLLWKRRQMAVSLAVCSQQRLLYPPLGGNHSFLYVYYLCIQTFQSNTNEVRFSVVSYSLYFPFNPMVSIFSCQFIHSTSFLTSLHVMNARWTDPLHSRYTT